MTDEHKMAAIMSFPTEWQKSALSKCLSCIMKRTSGIDDFSAGWAIRINLAGTSIRLCYCYSWRLQRTISTTSSYVRLWWSVIRFVNASAVTARLFIPPLCIRNLLLWFRHLKLLLSICSKQLYKRTIFRGGGAFSDHVTNDVVLYCSIMLTITYSFILPSFKVKGKTVCLLSRLYYTRFIYYTRPRP